MFKFNRTEIIKKILYQLISIILLIGIICTVVFLILPKNINDNSDDYYVFEPKAESYNTDTLKRGKLIKYLHFNGKIIRESNIIKQVSINKSKSLNCVIGSIVTKHEDISVENDINNYHKGRVIDITENSENFIISIDLAINYFAKFEISDSYSDIIQDIITGKIATSILINYNYLDFQFDEIDYNTGSCKYLLTFQLNSIDEYTYPNSRIHVKIKEKNYFKVIYLEPHIIKSITSDYNVILDRIFTDMGKVHTEEIKLPIIDLVDNKLIVDGSSYMGDEFIIYNKYSGVKLNE